MPEPKANERFGVIVPIVTPCSRAGRIDLDGLRAVCDDMVGAGVNGVFVMGSTGRGPWFGLRERTEACRAVAEHLGSGVPLYAGCMDAGLPRMLENARVMADAGAQVAIITAPGYFAYSADEVETVFLKFADASVLPVMVYDIPGFAGMKLDLQSILRVARHDHVIGFKDSTGDFERFQELLAGLTDRPGFGLVQGKEHLLLKSLRAGASGIVASLFHFNPRLFVDLYHAAGASNPTVAEDLQNRVDRLFELVGGCFGRRPETSTIFHLLNAALRKRRVCDNILLDHEGPTPDWLAAEADRALAILEG